MPILTSAITSVSTGISWWKSHHIKYLNSSKKLYNIRATSCEKNAFEHAQNVHIHIIQGLHPDFVALAVNSVVSNDFDSGQQRPRLDCAHAQMSSSMRKMCVFISFCACERSHSVFCSPLIHSIIFNDFDSGQ